MSVGPSVVVDGRISMSIVGSVICRPWAIIHECFGQRVPRKVSDPRFQIGAARLFLSLFIFLESCRLAVRCVVSIVGSRLKTACALYVLQETWYRSFCPVYGWEAWSASCVVWSIPRRREPKGRQTSQKLVPSRQG